MQAAIEVIKSHGANNSLLGIRSTYSEGELFNYKLFIFL
jgi:hypothetical protein